MHYVLRSTYTSVKCLYLFSGCKIVKKKKQALAMVAARFELARTRAHWESRILKSNALDQLGHATYGRPLLQFIYIYNRSLASTF
jgi:hypothetical protein